MGDFIVFVDVIVLLFWVLCVEMCVEMDDGDWVLGFVDVV